MTLKSSVRERVSEAEWSTRVDLAACYRLVARHGIEIQCARGFCKRYWIQSDLGD